LLNEKGCEINSECSNKETPLLRAVSKGYINIVKILLNQGANTRACLESNGNFSVKTTFSYLKGDTAFHIAARKQDKEMIELLAKNNSDFMRKNKKSETILDILLGSKDEELFKYTENLMIK
jgi:ankyrin repeat protein